MVIAVGIYWAAPIALTLWTIRKVPSRAAQAPIELGDRTISQTAGGKFSYFGHEFELSWSDVDPLQTRAETKLNTVVFTFRSGLQVSVATIPADGFRNAVATSFTSPSLFKPFMTSEFGPEATRSDYEFLTKLLAFTPNTMNRWALSPTVHYRENMLLVIKSTLLSQSADSGIFDVRSSEYKGFQQGSPKARPARIVVDLFSEDDGAEFIFSQGEYQNPAGVSQPEINRVIQSLHKVLGPTQVATSLNNEK